LGKVEEGESQRRAVDGAHPKCIQLSFALHQCLKIVFIHKHKIMYAIDAGSYKH
jgi:hypothetical protein